MGAEPGGPPDGGGSGACAPPSAGGGRSHGGAGPLGSGGGFGSGTVDVPARAQGRLAPGLRNLAIQLCSSLGRPPAPLACV